MSIRVSSNQMVYGYQKQLNDANTRQTKLLEQGDGSKLHRPSDNSVDYSKYLRYTVSENENVQYQDNVSTALSWMKTSDAALVNMTSIQTTFKEKTVAAANSTNNASDMAAIAKEMMAEIQELVSLGNTMQGDSYVFGGQKDLTKPFIMSTKEVERGLAKTLEENQAAFFSGDGAVDGSGSMKQMLTLTGDDGNTYYLNTKNGKIYTQEFVEEGYKDKIASESRTQVKDGDEIGTISGFDPAQSGTAKVADYFTNTGQLTTAGEGFSTGITVDGKTVTLKFATIKQQIVTYHGDDKGISMVKKNGTTEPVADTVNVTGPEIFGTDIFDDSASGNKASGSAMLNQMLTVRAQVESSNHKWLSKDGQTVADAAHSTTVNTETKLGARQQLYQSVQTMLDNQNEIITADITKVSSTDVAKLAVQLMQEQTIYNMSLSLGGRILPQSLADYL
ncbi:flagellar hook-associated protein FlgL [Selenomonas ruminis]|uniref:Flagellar hook-associated protein 3 n=1 Tax=Selenomonas ruminis TaxID=2593411 RepID=A0A5D6VXW0_9FIRM|nr:flagellar hook-associated protein FlgL [Selenomonas sp. mPRGC5]TYZ20320.1 flagellar hook-associated protein 3 [Selenomonas sp. mPRGC5]